jgi:precorrin-6B methylase 2
MASIGYHAVLLDDARRTRAFGRALRELVRPGDVVADLGAGTGILSLLALRAGAGRVYAIEKGPVASLARALARENGVADRLRVVRGRSAETRLPERADLVVTETLGPLAFDEGILEAAADARRRLLRPGGLIIPSRVRLIGAAAAAPRGRDWRYGVSLEAARALALHEPAACPASRLRGPAVEIGSARVGHDRLPMEFAGTLRAPEADGAALWFEAELSPSLRLSSLRGTSWMPVFLPARSPRRGRFRLRLQYRTATELTWRFDDDPPQDTALADERLMRGSP